VFNEIHLRQFGERLHAYMVVAILDEPAGLNQFICVVETL
jgi:hypothetical protein